ncbi:MAG: hypothetical protein QW272_07730 [Candidatus Methanomethylicaceae archaeon]
MYLIDIDEALFKIKKKKRYGRNKNEIRIVYTNEAYYHLVQN